VKTGAVLPVKRFTEAKQRLSDGLTPGVRRALAEAMLTDVLLALRRTSRVAEVVVVTAEPAAEAIARGYGARVAHDPHEDGQSAAVLIGLRELHDADCALLVPGDCPALDALEVDALLASVAEVEEAIVVVPDRHGTGTNGLVLRPPDAILPAFGPGSRERHEELARAAGLPARVEPLPSLILDVDTVSDLDAMRAALERSHGGAAFTRGLLRRLARSGDVPARA
jgi:2-phospho-L-lactate/phosphoenolpyruvate guanylyltransferase